MLSFTQMSPWAERTLPKITWISLLLAAGACLILWIVRIRYAISFVTPYMMVTTGAEEESLFAVWKFTHHQALYADPHRIPFAASYFNWGFYYFYGSITNFWLNLLHLDAIWIPTIGRLISLAITLAAGVVFIVAVRSLVQSGLFADSRFAWAWCLIAVLSPLIGFWSITVRPDLGALLFEFTGLYLVLRYLRKENLLSIFGAVILFYAAWAFKQTAVTMIAGSALALLLYRRWRAFFILTGFWWLLVALTLIIGGPVFRECLIFSQAHLPLLVSFGTTNALRAETKNIFLFPCLALLLALSWLRFRRNAAIPAQTLLTFVALFAFCFALVTSCKAGANDNYFIPAAWAGMLGFALAWEQLGSRWVMMGLIACSWLTIATIALTPIGHGFYYDYRGSDRPHRAVAEKLASLPYPAIVTERYSNLPWVQSHAPHFVLSFAYDYDRKAGVPLEDGGWEGLAEEGYFETVVIDQSYSPAPILLKKYKLVDEYQDAFTDYKFYRRAEPADH